MVRDGETTPTEVLQEAAALADSRNPELAAVLCRFDDAAAKSIANGLPDGPFRGVPMLLKDLGSVMRNQPMTFGAAKIRWIPDHDSIHVERIKKSGAVIFGKTNTPEFGLSITTEPRGRAATHNPHRHRYSPGGSSGGSAAAVAAGIVPIASAGDGGGSIRFPASWCGVFGLKPSRGLVPLGPDLAEGWSGGVSDHVITRTVRDSAAMLDCTAGYAAGGPYRVDGEPGAYQRAAASDPDRLRIGVSRVPLITDTEVDPEVLAALDATAEQLADMGHEVVDAEPAIDRSRFWLDFFTVVMANLAFVERDTRERFGREAVDALEPETRNVALLGRSLSATDLLTAKDGWRKAQLAMGEYLTEHDVMLCPTVPTVAVPHGSLRPSRTDEFLMDLNRRLELLQSGKVAMRLGMVEPRAKKMLCKMAFTIPGNVTGLPAMSVPLHMSSSGLPIGMQFYGPMGGDALLFSLAGQLERASLFTTG